MELTRQQARHRVLVDSERMPQGIHVTPHDANPRVDLLASVVARVPEREATFGAYLGVVAANRPFGYGDVVVLHHDVRLTCAPQGVEGAQIFPGEVAFDPRVPERPRHRAVELPSSAERDGLPGGPEVAQDARENFIALLPVAAGDVKRHLRFLTPGGRSLKRDTGLLGRELARLKRGQIPIEAEPHIARRR